MEVEHHAQQAEGAEHGKVERRCAAFHEEMRLESVEFAGAELGACAAQLRDQHFHAARVALVKLREAAARLQEVGSVAGRGAGRRAAVFVEAGEEGESVGVMVAEIPQFW